MNKLLKCLSPVVLVLYISVFSCPAWAKEGDITAKVDMPGGIHQGTTFAIKATFYREDASGTKKPILDKSAVRIELPEGFNIQSDSISSTVEGQRMYQIVAPMNEGEYPITLLVDSQKEVPSKFSYKINVVNPVSYYLSAAIIIIGVSLLLATVLNTFSQNWKGKY